MGVCTTKIEITMDKSACLTTPFYMVMLFTCFIVQVECQCTWSNDASGYQNVKTLNTEGFLEWILNFGILIPGEVGPKAGYEEGPGDCYVVTRGGSDGERALLLSPCYTAQPSQNVELSFAYYLYGDNAGTLTVYWRPGCLEPKDLPMEIGTVVGDPIVGSQIDGWVETQRTISKNTIGSPFQIIFEATMKGETNNSIAVDIISIQNATTATTNQPTTVVTPIRTTSSPSTNAPITSAPISTNSSASISQETNAQTSATLAFQETTKNASIVTTTAPTVATTTSPSRTSDSSQETTDMNDITRASPLVSSQGRNDSQGGMPTTPEMNVTLNFCEANLVIEGLDNCTFIGLMFAIVPLGIIFLVWLVCCTFNRYCRKVEQSDGHGYGYGDAESSMGKDHFASNSYQGGGYGYNSSLTDNTFVNSTSPENTVTRSSTAGATTAVENSHEMDTLLEENGEQRTSENSDFTKSSRPNEYDVPDRINHVNGEGLDSNITGPEGGVENDSEVGPKGGSADHPYAVLDGPTPSAEPEDHNRHADSTPSSKDVVEIAGDISVAQSSTEEVTYHVLEGPTPPSPPESPRSPLKNDSGNESSSSHDIDVDDSKVPQNSTEYPTYNVLEGPTPPSPPNSPRPPQSRDELEVSDRGADGAYETVQIDDSPSTGKIVSISSVPSVPIDDAKARLDQSDIEPYADSVIGQHADNSQVYDMSDKQTLLSNKSANGNMTPNDEAAYETIPGKPGKVQEDEGSGWVDNVVYSSIDDDPKIGVTTIDSDGNEDTPL